MDIYFLTFVFGVVSLVLVVVVIMIVVVNVLVVVGMMGATFVVNPTQKADSIINSLVVVHYYDGFVDYG